MLLTGPRGLPAHTPEEGATIFWSGLLELALSDEVVSVIEEVCGALLRGFAAALRTQMAVN